MRFALAILLVLHGAAHLVGFVVPWRLASLPDAPRGTTILAGAVDVGETGIRAVGIGWLVLAIAFVAVAAGLLQGAPWWYPAALVVLVASSAFCVVGLPAARIGLWVNAVLVALVIISARLDWFTMAR